MDDDSSQSSFWIVSVQGDPTPKVSLQKVVETCRDLSAISNFPVPELKVRVGVVNKKKKRQVVNGATRAIALRTPREERGLSERSVHGRSAVHHPPPLSLSDRHHGYTCQHIRPAAEVRPLH